VSIRAHVQIMKKKQSILFLKRVTKVRYVKNSSNDYLYIEERT